MTKDTQQAVAADEVESGEVQQVGAIDLTPTWGEVGLLFWRLAQSGERKAMDEMRSDFAKAWAALEVVKQLLPTLTPEQREVFDRLWEAERKKVQR